LPLLILLDFPLPLINGLDGKRVNAGGQPFFHKDFGEGLRLIAGTDGGEDQHIGAGGGQLWEHRGMGAWGQD